MSDRTTFAVCLGNRGFFPGSLMDAARREMTDALHRRGYEALFLDASATRYGAVETREEGMKFARFLAAHEGRYDGVILCLPNFGDENGAVAALQDARTPILIQAYPDDLDKMAPECRRDAFCGKFSVMDMFHQCGIRFTALPPHTIAPASPTFAAHLDYFARVCRVVKTLRRLVVGAVGARTTAFKTVRIDETALQRHGITMETFDLSDVFARMRAVDASGEAYRAKTAFLKDYGDWSAAPAQTLDRLARLGVTLDALRREYAFDALAIRCWMEMQQELGISPCVLLSALNDGGVPAACEVDVGNAVMMAALARASNGVATCLDWNNNYADADTKCILFHCGPVPRSMMTAPGRISDHAILANAVGPGRGFGCLVGRIAPAPITFASLLTEEGRLKAYLGQGRFTEDAVPADFFGCAGVADIPHLQDVLLHVGRAGYRHHVSVATGHVLPPLREALTHYLGWDVAIPQGE